MRKSSLFWMLAPVVGLAAFAVAPRKSSTPRAPGLYVESVVFEPASPRDVSEGFDRRARVILNYAGVKPKWWGAIASSMMHDDPMSEKYQSQAQNGSWRIGGAFVEIRAGRRVRLDSEDKKGVEFKIPRWDKPRFWNVGRYVVPCRLKLRDLPKVKGETRLRISAGANKAPRLVREVAVRRGGEIVKPPDVSRETQVRIVSKKIEKLPPSQSYFQGDCRVSVRVKFLGTESSVDWQESSQTFVEDSHGKKWTWFPREDGSQQALGMYFGPPPPYKEHTFTWQFHTAKLPPGRLVFKSGVGMGEGWVEPIEVVLRTGKERAPRLPPSSLRLLDVQLRKATTAEKKSNEDTSAIVSFAAKRALPRKPLWITDHSQHLMDARGQKHWTVKDGTGGEGMITAGKPIWNAERRCWQVRYGFRLGQIARGAVRFRAKIGLPGETLMPVEYLARKS
ncbi:MAG TPA: hypothetical protein VF681_06045 [Abditibacteriaceae bacterium]|jgi:hypothetical protein